MISHRNALAKAIRLGGGRLLALFLLYAPLAFRVSSHQNILVAHPHNGAILPPRQAYAIIRKGSGAFAVAANTSHERYEKFHAETTGSEQPDACGDVIRKGWVPPLR